MDNIPHIEINNKPGWKPSRMTGFRRHETGKTGRKTEKPVPVQMPGLFRKTIRNPPTISRKPDYEKVGILIRERQVLCPTITTTITTRGNNRYPVIPITEYTSSPFGHQVSGHETPITRGLARQVDATNLIEPTMASSQSCISKGSSVYETPDTGYTNSSSSFYTAPSTMNSRGHETTGRPVVSSIDMPDRPVVSPIVEWNGGYRPREGRYRGGRGHGMLVERTCLTISETMSMGRGHGRFATSQGRNYWSGIPVTRGRDRDDTHQHMTD